MRSMRSSAKEVSQRWPWPGGNGNGDCCWWTKKWFLFWGVHLWGVILFFLPFFASSFGASFFWDDFWGGFTTCRRWFAVIAVANFVSCCLDTAGAHAAVEGDFGRLQIQVLGQRERATLIGIQWSTGSKHLRYWESLSLFQVIYARPIDSHEKRFM